MASSNVHELGLSSLVYVSRCNLHLDGDAQAVNEIVQTAISRNAHLRVTGALVYTVLHFGQVLEGPAAAIEDLMSCIRKDERHRDVTVVASARIPSRNFENWSMAYSGPSPYFDRHLKRLISPATSADARAALVGRLMSHVQEAVRARPE